MTVNQQTFFIGPSYIQCLHASSTAGILCLSSHSKLTVPQLDSPLADHSDSMQSIFSGSDLVYTILKTVSQCRISYRQCLSAEYSVDSVSVLTHLQTVIVSVLSH